MDHGSITIDQVHEYFASHNIPSTTQTLTKIGLDIGGGIYPINVSGRTPGDGMRENYSGWILQGYNNMLLVHDTAPGVRTLHFLYIVR